MKLNRLGLPVGGMQVCIIFYAQFIDIQQSNAFAGFDDTVLDALIDRFLNQLDEFALVVLHQ